LSPSDKNDIFWHQSPWRRRRRRRRKKKRGMVGDFSSGSGGEIFIK